AGPHAGSTARARFRTEAEAVARLQHANVVQIYEVGEHDGRPFLAMEYVDGGSLLAMVAGKPQPALEAARLVETLAWAVQAVHQRGILHRDLKPANILLSTTTDRRSTSEGRSDDLAPRSSIIDLRSSIPKISDFGLAKVLGTDTGPTASEGLVGTPGYM